MLVDHSLVRVELFSFDSDGVMSMSSVGGGAFQRGSNLEELK